MSNGSTKTSDGLRPRQAVRRDRTAAAWLIVFLSVLGGCHHRTLHDGPDLQTELRKVTGEQLFQLGVSHAGAGDLLRAEQYLSAARSRGHDEAMVVYWLVRVCVAASRFQSALAHAAQYLRDNPDHWSLRLVVASIYEALGDQERAEQELRRLVRAEPQRPLPHYRLGMLYRAQAIELDRARVHLQAYLRLSPGGPHAAEARAALSEDAFFGEGPARIPMTAVRSVAPEAER